MKDYSQTPAYAQRALITGWVETDGHVAEVQGFYCSNGPHIDGRRNVKDAHGVVGPGPESDYPMYYAPEVGYSINSDQFFATREEAVEKARAHLLKQQDAIAQQLAAL